MNPPSIEIPVVIAGAGPAGLTMSLLLSRKGIRHLVLEKRERIGTLPRARGINVRSVEILTQLGLGDDLAQDALVPPWTDSFLYTETLAGPIIGRMPGLMAPGAAAPWSPCAYRVAAQDRLDPMLHEHARRQGNADVRLGHEVTGFDQDASGIAVQVRRSDDAAYCVQARYLIAADGGGSPLRALAGIAQAGQPNLRSFVNVHLHADLSRFTAGREATLIWTLAPGVEGLFQPLDGQRKWAVQIQFDPSTDTVEAWTRERIVERLRAMIGSAHAHEVGFEILNVYAYTLSVMLAQRLRSGRVLLAGDAAHKIPPYGGFGLNTGIQSAHNLAWKLAAVLRGQAGEALLDSYETERLEVARRNCAFGRTNAGYVEQMMGALRAAGSLEARQEAFRRSRQYGNWMGLDLGAHYEGPGAFVPDEAPVPAVDDPVIDYVAHGKPGWRAPHFWLKQGGLRRSVIELFDAEFVLLAGEQGQAWVDAAGLADLPARIEAHRVGSDGGLVPEDGVDFCTLYGIAADGAVLVRPDGHVAFRSPSTVSDPADALSAAMKAVLSPATSTS